MDGCRGVQEVSHLSGALNDRGVRRWVIAVAATATFMVAGGYLGSVGSAQAGGEPGTDDVGSPSLDGLSVTCYAYNLSLRDDALICNVVGDGEAGPPIAVYRLVPAAKPSVRPAPDATK
jgi:hypothetical protein